MGLSSNCCWLNGNLPFVGIGDEGGSVGGSVGGAVGEPIGGVVGGSIGGVVNGAVGGGVDIGWVDEAVNKSYQ